MFPIPLQYRLNRAAGTTTIILDQFTDTNGTAIASHTIAPINKPATAWTAGTGTWDIQSNTAGTTGNTARAHATLDTGKANYTITDTIVPGATDVAFGIVFRYLNGLNYWRFFLNDTADTYSLEKYETGGSSIEATGAITVTPGDTYIIKVVANGPNVICFVNGAVLVTYATATFQQTNELVGMVQNRSDTTHNNFTVET